MNALSPSWALTGMRVVVRGNGEKYSVHLRTLNNVRPWQSYRAHFTAGSDWENIDLPFETFVPYRLETPELLPGYLTVDPLPKNQTISAWNFPFMFP
jgi:hypothetical protein